MVHRVLIAGAGIGGLAAALACARLGFEVRVLEAAAAFGEIGAGIQLGPNAMKVLAALGLEQEILRVASLPQAILVHDAHTGRPISRMLLGEAARQRYGQAYISIHRADLHDVLLRAASHAGVQTTCSAALQRYELSPQGVRVLGQGVDAQSDVLLGADGLWSRVREQLLGDGSPRATGHAAFRALVPQSAVPPALRTPHVRLWWARKMHVVSYPVRGGSLYNVVVLAQMASAGQAGWNLSAAPEDVLPRFERVEPQLLGLLQAVADSGQAWNRWNLFDRDPIAAAQMAQGRVALMGDAAHPMLPYLAQGAAMALEDAWTVGQCLHRQPDAQMALRAYAQQRAARTARVVQTARRNGHIFHLSEPLALARNAFLAWRGTEVVGLPWLYGQSVV